MSNKVIPYTGKDKVEYIQFYCFGCACYHQYIVKGDESKMPVWKWNKDLNKPTITPSLMSKWSYGPNEIENICHLYVKNGQIEYLKDCTHKFAGQTVDLQDEV